MPEEAPKKLKFLNCLAADTLAGYLAGALVAPSVSAVDRALAENASGKCALFPSFINSFKEMFAAPIKFVKSPQFLWIWAIYGTTYVTANATQTICDETKRDVALPKLASTFVVNTSICIAKDRAFAKMYGTASAKPVPPAAYGAWLVRDVGSMFVFFTLPPIVGKKITEASGGDMDGYYIAQMTLPLVFQSIFTPIHLLGYDIYNNPKNTLGQRIQFLQKDYFKNVGMRCIRQAPPWSFGTIGNKTFRDKFTAAFN